MKRDHTSLRDAIPAAGASPATQNANIAVQASLPGFAVTDHTPAGADDKNSQPIEHRAEFRGAAVDASAWPADAANVLDQALPVGAVLQLKP